MRAYPGLTRRLTQGPVRRLIQWARLCSRVRSCKNGAMTHNLILLRHGESEWNQKNLFTGWV
ncbi:MAG: hypothetical protein ACTMIV_05930, partial [Brevibacterium aurantiacum]